MQWQFRKTLESFQTYKANHLSYVTEVEKGSSGVLNTLIRQIQLVMSENDGKIISKLSSMRFAKQIMILGRPDVSRELSKLVPHIVKVCSHRMQSNDPNRGQTLFCDHPSYRNGSDEEKKVIQLYGSTYFTLCLQSIYHWAKWIPVDQNNKQSAYAKGYQMLIDRGVIFGNEFHYYKNSDSEKFRNTYKVQFFSESDYEMNTSYQSMSQFSEDSSSHYYEPPVQTNDRKNSIKDLNSIKELRQYYNSKLLNKPHNRNSGESLADFNKQVLNVYRNSFPQSNSPLNNMLQLTHKQNDDKKWIQNFINSYKSLCSNKIDYHIFCEKIKDYSQESSNNLEQNAKQISFRKQKKSAKREISPCSRNVQRQTKITQNQSNDKILQNFQEKKNTNSSHQIQKLQKQHKLQKQRLNHQFSVMKRDYQSKISQLNISNDKKNKKQLKQLQKEKQRLNENLKEYQKTIYQLQKRNTKNMNSQDKYQKQYLQKQVINLANVIQNLRGQNEILKKNNKKNAEIDKYGTRIKQLEDQISVNNKKNQQIILQKQSEINHLKDQLETIKKQFISQRQAFKKQLIKNQQRIKILQTENYELKNLDPKLRNISKTEHNYKISANKQESDKSMTPPRKSQQYNNATSHNFYLKKSQENPKNGSRKLTVYRGNFQYKKFLNIRNVFGSQKQKYLRFSRATLKRKDLLLKQSQFQIGVISQVLSLYQLKFVLHLTNQSDIQIDQLKIRIQKPHSMQHQLSTQYIFNLQPRQQQKVVLKCYYPNILEHDYQPLSLIVNYKKNEIVHEHLVFIPYCLFKTLQFYEYDKKSILSKTDNKALTMKISKKMIPNEQIITTYFPSIIKTTKNVYECEIFQRQINFRANLRLSFLEHAQLLIQLCPIQKSNVENTAAFLEDQQKAMYDLMSFFEFTFKKAQKN